MGSRSVIPPHKVEPQHFSPVNEDPYPGAVVGTGSVRVPPKSVPAKIGGGTSTQAWVRVARVSRSGILPHEVEPQHFPPANQDPYPGAIVGSGSVRSPPGVYQQKSGAGRAHGAERVDREEGWGWEGGCLVRSNRSREGGDSWCGLHGAGDGARYGWEIGWGDMGGDMGGDKANDTLCAEMCGDTCLNETGDATGLDR